MLKRVVQRSRSWVVAGLLFAGLLLCLWLGSSRPAQAEKAMKFLAFDATDGTVEVAAIYETSYAAQKGVVKSLKTSSKLMKKAAGFKGFSMLQSQDGKQVIAFSQWQDLASYQAYTPPQTADSGKATGSATATMPPAPSQIVPFEVAGIQTAIAGATPALRGKEAVVQLAQFTARAADDRAQVLSRVEAMVPDILQKQPIPQSIVLLKGIETGAAALMINWNCSALFEDVGKPTAIVPDDELATLADSEQRLYNVVNLIPAEVKKEEE